VEAAVIAEKACEQALERYRPGRPPQGPLNGKRVLVSAGPTREPLDPVRYLSNPSSGKMGYAIAEACRDLGAEVTLVSGPTSLADPTGLSTVRVTTAKEMLAACQKAFAKADAFIAAAAVSDFRPAQAAAHKKKKDGKPESLRLEANPDILLTLSKKKGQKVLIGFAAETRELIRHAQEKYAHKKLDLLVANEVGPGKGFEVDQNAVTLIKAGQAPERLPLQPKSTVAARIALELAALLGRA
jgi:phosphopantothenoylcysteine decarboxylase/phosphopantothenate--cysteine ligase